VPEYFRQCFLQYATSTAAPRRITFDLNQARRDARVIPTMDRGVSAAIRRFPRRSLEIRRLAVADGSFRSLCGDLREAEEALERWNRIPSDQAVSRRQEYNLLVEELAREIEGIVDRRSRVEYGAR
jgi:hypothetical protein